MAPAIVTELWRYPVKSMQGESIAAAEVTEAGFVGDRSYALLDPALNKIGSAKHPRLWATLLQCRARYVEEPVAGEPPPPVVITLPDGTDVRSDDPDVNDRLSAVVERPVQLVTKAPDTNEYLAVWPEFDGVMPDDLRRMMTVDGEQERDGTLASHRVSIAAPKGTMFDVAALHLLTLPTLRHLGEVAPGSRFTVSRYRPNVVLDGPSPPFAENDWTDHTLALGGDGVAASVFGPTMRCIMTTLAQGDLPRDVEVLRTATLHNRLNLPTMGGTWSCVGAYAAVASGGKLEVGDEAMLP